MSLRLDWCSYAAAKFAVETWHYSHQMPVGKMVTIGVWENKKFIGCVIFSRGANAYLGDSLGLESYEICELTRVALTAHASPVSKICAIAIRLFAKQCPGIKAIVSFADERQGHHGGIYQAMNWVYLGKSAAGKEWLHNGEWKHNREITSGAFGKKSKIRDYKSLPSRVIPGKHKYIFPLDAAVMQAVKEISKPYPKRETRAESVGSDTPGNQPGEGGAVPTSALLEDDNGRA